MNWLVSKNKRRLGPFTTEAVFHYLQSGQLSRDDLVWTEGLIDWTPIANTVEFSDKEAMSAEHERSKTLPPIDLFAANDSNEQRPLETLQESPAGNGPNETAADQKPQASLKKDGPGAVHRYWNHNYITRHWRGELSLAKSYWLTSIYGLLVATALAALGQSLSFTDFPKASASYWIFVWGFILLLNIWQYVGLFRSASRYNRERPTMYWGRVAQIMGGLGALSSAYTLSTVALPQVGGFAKIFAQSLGEKQYSFRVLRDGTEVELAGRLDFGVGKDFKMFLDAYPNVKTIHLGSVGGRLAEAEEIIHEIEQRGLNTYVAVECDSACAEVFAAGKERLISQTGRIGLHSPQFPGLSDSDLSTEKTRAIDYFISRGIDRTFIERGLSTPAESMWYPTSEELLSSGLATGYAGDNDVAATMGLGADTAKAIELLESQPIFVAIKSKFPVDYAKIDAFVKDGISKGQTLGEIRSKTLEIVLSVYARALAVAGDDEVLAFYRMQYREAKSLESLDPQKCVAFFSGKTSQYEYSDIPQSAKEDELEVGTDLVNSVGSYSGGTIAPEITADISSNILNQMSKRTGLSNDEILKGVNLQLSPARNCMVQLVFFETVFDLPERQRSVFLRFISQP